MSKYTFNYPRYVILVIGFCILVSPISKKIGVSNYWYGYLDSIGMLQPKTDERNNRKDEQ